MLCRSEDVAPSETFKHCLLTNLRGTQITFFRQHFTTRRRNDIFTPSVQVREQPREASL